MPIHVLFDIIQHLDMIVKLVSYLDAQFPLSANTDSQSIQLLVLRLNNVFMILVDLLIV